VVQQPNLDLNHRIVDISSLHTFGHTRPVELTWTIDQLVAEAATYTTNTIEHPFPRRRSNPRSEQSNGCRPTPYTARPPLSSSTDIISVINTIICDGGRTRGNFGKAMQTEFWWENLTEGGRVENMDF